MPVELVRRFPIRGRDANGTHKCFAAIERGGKERRIAAACVQGMPFLPNHTDDAVFVDGYRRRALLRSAVVKQARARPPLSSVLRCRKPDLVSRRAACR